MVNFRDSLLSERISLKFQRVPHSTQMKNFQHIFLYVITQESYPSLSNFSNYYSLGRQCYVVARFTVWRFSLRIWLHSAVIPERVVPRAPIVRVKVERERDSRVEPRGSGSLPVKELERLTVGV